MFLHLEQRFGREIIRSSHKFAVAGRQVCVHDFM